MAEPNVTRAIVTPTSAVLVFIAPTLVTVAQVVSGNPSSGLWALLEGGLAILCVLYAVVIPWFATRSFRKMRAAFASENEQGVARIVAMRSSVRRYGRFAVGIERQKLLYGADRYDVESHARLATDPLPDADNLLFVH